METSTSWLFTKWVEAFAIQNQVTTVAKALDHNFCYHCGVSVEIHMVQERNIESDVFIELCHLLVIENTSVWWNGWASMEHLSSMCQKLLVKSKQTGMNIYCTIILNGL